jgi:hypothetical protein
LRQAGQTLKEPIWERQDWESDKQWKAFSDYMRLPITTRDLKTLLGSYNKIVEAGSEYVPSFIPGREDDTILSQTYIPPTNSYGTILKWSSWGHWAERSQAHEKHIATKIAQARNEQQALNIQANVRSELEQVEEFRNSMVLIGRNMVAYGSYIMKLLDTTTRVYPLGSALDDRAIAKLKDVAFIYRACVTDGIPKGQDVWAQGLGIQEAIDIIGKDVSDSEAA